MPGLVLGRPTLRPDPDHPSTYPWRLRELGPRGPPDWTLDDEPARVLPRVQARVTKGQPWGTPATGGQGFPRVRLKATPKGGQKGALHGPSRRAFL